MCVFIVMAVFTTSGTFMLLFLAGLQNIDESVNEAAALDGATEWRKFRHITVPMIRPTLFTVVTLGLIGTWQVFDQIYVGTKGSPLNTTLTPAFLSFNESFNSNNWGVGAAIAFILFAIIVFFTIATRVLRPARSRPAPVDQERFPRALQGPGLPPLGEELRDRDAQRHVPARVPRQPCGLCAGASTVPRTRPRLRDDRRRDGGAGRSAPDPEVPDHPAVRDVRHLLRNDR